jgi:DNA-binding transcriptional LysR family regulator
MQEVTLKMLVILDEVYRTQSISQAAENLDLGQPAVSMSLAKLRKHFDDALFVRTSKGMAPTPLAQTLLRPTREALSLLKIALGQQVVFDPLISQRVFNLCSTDFGPEILMRPLRERFRTVAPNIRFNLTTLSENTTKLLESGEIDVAIGLMPRLGPGFCQQQLFRETFVCIASVDHPRIKNRLTMEQFESESHIIVTTNGTGHNIVNQTLEKLKRSRVCAVQIHSFLLVSALIENTDYLAMVPKRYAQCLARTGRIKIFELPFAMPGYGVRQHWHERYSRDPGLTWLRKTIKEVFLE